ncbi:MAG TPA: UTP--glucose-1-phosphate uridylyltransferase [Chloroflexota bacterium]|nr:UTP--glucose-1-phosphate uridylyltransferase [Chloroflexota bacterium]
MTRVRKAVIPAAGLGTRFLPASKAVPKEMLPIVDKPVIQYIVEGAVASGIEEIVLVTAAGKRSIEDHFDSSFELEYRLEAAGKHDLLAETRRPAEMARFVMVRQGSPLGNGHAVLLAKEVVGDEPFAMLWGDDIVLGDPPFVQQLIDAYNRTGGSVVGVIAVPPEEAMKYGVIEVAERLDDRLVRASRIVEKPPRDQIPSNLAAVAGYILTPDIFGYLEETQVGQGGEIWLADGVQKIAEQGNLYALEFTGRRYDAGNKGEYLQATVDLALAHPDLGPAFRAYIEEKLRQPVAP